MTLRLPFLLAPLALALAGCPSTGTDDKSDAASSTPADSGTAPAADSGLDAGLPAEADASAVAGADAAPALPVGLALTDIERAVKLSPDGRTALLWQQSTGALYFRDTATGQLDQKTTLDTTDLQTQQPMALSATGRIGASYGVRPEHPGLWDPVAGWLELGSVLPGCVDTSVTPSVVSQYGTVFGLSADGHVAVGLLWADCAHVQAFRWTDASGSGAFTLLELIGTGPGGVPNDRASVVSADGRVSAGWASNDPVDRSPAVWGADGHGFLLAPTDLTEPGEAKAISADGKVVLGDWARDLGGQSGFVWTQEGGVVRFSTETPDADTLIVNAATADGTHAFGQLSHTELVYGLPEQTYQGAFVWSQAQGVRKLDEVAVAHGIVLETGVTLNNVMSVSADGTVILGEAAIAPAPGDPLGFPTYKTYVLVLPGGAFE